MLNNIGVQCRIIYPILVSFLDDDIMINDELDHNNDSLTVGDNSFMINVDLIMTMINHSLTVGDNSFMINDDLIMTMIDHSLTVDDNSFMINNDLTMTMIDHSLTVLPIVTNDHRSAAHDQINVKPSATMITDHDLLMI